MKKTVNKNGTITYDTIHNRMKQNIYKMSFRNSRAKKVIEILKEIDDENCFCPNRGDFIQKQGEFIEVGLSRDSLPIFCRRLCEKDEIETKQIASGIFWNLGIDEVMGC